MSEAFFCLILIEFEIFTRDIEVMMMLDIDSWVYKSGAQERSGHMIQIWKLSYKAMKINEIT